VDRFSNDAPLTAWLERAARVRRRRHEHPLNSMHHDPLLPTSRLPERDHSTQMNVAEHLG
jgi:hypothetical protein